MANSDIDFNNTTDFGTVKIRMLQGAKGEKGEKGDDGISGDYAGLINKPQINGETLTGNKTTEDLGLLSEMELNTFKDEVEASFTETNGNLSDLQDEVTQFKGDTAYEFEQIDDRLSQIDLDIADRYTKAETDEILGNTFYRSNLFNAWSSRYSFTRLEPRYVYWDVAIPEGIYTYYTPILVAAEGADVYVSETDLTGYQAIVNGFYARWYNRTTLRISGYVMIPNNSDAYNPFSGVCRLRNVRVILAKDAFIKYFSVGE